ncbi:DUF1489 domain-containing protein [Sphingomonas sp. KC8]|uniref:DUF1489 domain-containing protein n=1 Tax=Sphingomonas sp. KC8 TaxID=1030157 RepID=UPI000248A80B|nr:DUF1489 domain-containing protein [Sphingomonas sp. KC8]ARS26998.1 hypothetical protein KC8_06810 [Sphingomonas sp. KC8]
MLHMTKVAVGCSSLDILRDRIGAHAANGTAAIHTRYRPTRADEMVGGSLYWIIAHRLVARQTILGFEEAEGGRCVIRVDARLVPVRARPKRAHQGWRYLAAADAPDDFDGGDADVSAMPKAMIDELSALSLI